MCSIPSLCRILQVLTEFRRSIFSRWLIFLIFLEIVCRRDSAAGQGGASLLKHQNSHGVTKEGPTCEDLESQNIRLPILYSLVIVELLLRIVVRHAMCIVQIVDSMFLLDTCDLDWPWYHFSDCQLQEDVLQLPERI